MRKIAIFASGSGTNAENIVLKSKEGDDFEVVEVFCNVEGAGVFERMSKLGIPCTLLSRKSLYENEEMANKLKSNEIDLIVLAGFLLLIPSYLIKSYPNAIINLHPSLLPKHGGKGMYGMNVHRAVIKGGDEYSGITIHYVNERFDEGEVILQERIKVNKGETPEALASRIHELEYKYFPKVILDQLRRGE